MYAMKNRTSSHSKSKDKGKERDFQRPKNDAAFVYMKSIFIFYNSTICIADFLFFQNDNKSISSNLSLSNKQTNKQS